MNATYIDTQVLHQARAKELYLMQWSGENIASHITAQVANSSA